MEPPRFLAIFNQPIPQVTVGRRDRATVPEQALALLNDPFVRSMADAWAEKHRTRADGDMRAAAAAMLAEGLGRPPRANELERILAVVEACSAARAPEPAARRESPTVWSDVAHTILMMPEFSHVE
jgi:hypothetical protein